MSSGEKGLYTPIVLRTGFLHSYRRTLPLLLSVVTLEAVFWTLAGFWPRFDELGLLRWGLIVILSIVVPLATSTIRDIVAAYANLFGVFDEETEKKLKLHASLGCSCSEAQEGVRRLFKDDGAYAAFQERIRKVVFDRTTDIVLVITILGVSGFVVYNTIYEKTVLRAATPNSALLILEIAIDAYATVFLVAALSFLFMFGIGYFYVLSRLGASREDLSIWKFIEYLRGTPAKDRSFVSYWRFHDSASAIGQHFSGVASRIVLLMALGGLAQVLYNVSTSTVVTWILALVPVVLGVVVLVVPLNSLHRVLHDAKAAVLKELEEAYDRLALGFINHLAEHGQSQSAGRTEISDRALAANTMALKGIVEETRQESTWPVRAPVVLRILATSLIPLVYFFAEELLRAFWLD